MKLLSWMHRKLQKDATGSLHASVVGSTSTCLLLLPPNDDSKQKWQPNQHCKEDLKEFSSENTEDFNEEQYSEIFPGFLTIGTLSVEPISEPPTPTFDLPYQVTDEGAMTEMKYDLKLINEELEKFFKVEAENEESIESSRKNSQASTITLSDELKEELRDYNSVKMQIHPDYPLQGYLLGSSTELRETKPKEKKEKTSMCKLFKKSTTKDRRQKQATIGIKSSDHLTNKMLLPTQISPQISYSSTGHAAESFLTLRKLKKINRLFHKKIHPEINKAAFAAKEPKSSKYKTKKDLNSYVDSVISGGKSRISCWGILKKGKKHGSMSNIKLPEDAITSENLDAMKDEGAGAGMEQWIKTDEEYFVLELQQNKGVQTSDLEVIYA